MVVGPYMHIYYFGIIRMSNSNYIFEIIFIIMSLWFHISYPRRDFSWSSNNTVESNMMPPYLSLMIYCMTQQIPPTIEFF